MLFTQRRAGPSATHREFGPTVGVTYRCAHHNVCKVLNHCRGCVVVSYFPSCSLHRAQVKCNFCPIPNHVPKALDASGVHFPAYLSVSHKTTVGVPTRDLVNHSRDVVFVSFQIHHLFASLPKILSEPLRVIKGASVLMACGDSDLEETLVDVGDPVDPDGHTSDFGAWDAEPIERFSQCSDLEDAQLPGTPLDESSIFNIAGTTRQSPAPKTPPRAPTSRTG